MTDWTLRPATPRDAPQLAACIDAAYARYRARGIALPDVSGGISVDIADNIAYVAAAGSDILGGIVLIAHPDYLQLANIAVHPDQGRQGIGKALLAQVDKVARNLGLSRLRLATHIEMPENVALYRLLGWTEMDRIDTKVMMEKRL